MQDPNRRTQINSSEFSKRELLQIDHDRHHDNSLRPTMRHFGANKQQIKVKLPNSSRDQFPEEIVPWSESRQSNRKFKNHSRCVALDRHQPKLIQEILTTDSFRR